MIRCTHCLSEIPAGRSACAFCGTVRADAGDATSSSAAAAAAPARTDETPLDRGRFIAGTVLAGRYRIIGLLGRGGMGEVYKAEDLRLHQLAALKFLPEALSGDPSMVARFHREVRTARQITHPNVCRVHDIGQIPFSSATLHFISMEYIDGEDLATLLRRIGHLPIQKGMELARQICAGLSAAHEIGVVHRDLKPANIMLDGRGRARITDFGLSGVVEEFGRDEHSGTPAYMAPEQLNGAPATTQTDIYALGLVLYEILTGKRPFEGKNVAELIDQHRTATPPPPSSRIREIDPMAERAILRCLSQKPAERPTGPIEVLAALSGGDLLGKTLAAGETPSPEMVAAAGEKTGLVPSVAWACLIVISIVCVLVAVPMNPATVRHRSLGPSPDVLINSSKKLLGDLGYPASQEYVSGFGVDATFVDYAHKDRDANGFQLYLSESRPSWARFLYQPNTPMPDARSLPVFARLGARVKNTDQLTLPTAPTIVLDPQGYLAEFRTFRGKQTAQPDATHDWNILFNAAGIDQTSLAPAVPRASPTVPFDSQIAWQGTWPGRPDIPLVVEGALSRGTPVFFRASGPWSSEAAPPRQEARQQAFVAINIAVVVFILLLVTTIPLARHNLRAGRGDQRGAYRVGLFTFAVLLLSWVFGSDHRLDPREPYQFVVATGEALFRSVVVGLLYLAIEPFIRQRWPHALISWNRVLEGSFRDPLVGRAALIGILFAAVNALLRNTLLMTTVMSPVLPEPDLLNAMLSNSYSVSFLLALISDSVSIPLGLFALFSTFRILLRNRWLAGIVLTFIINAYVNLQHPEISGLVVAVVFSTLWLVGVMRFGLIAGMSMWFADRVFRAWSMLAPAEWYSTRLYFMLSAVIALSVFAFVTSLGRQPLVPPELLGGPRTSADRV